jgi:hypothetical protein
MPICLNLLAEAQAQEESRRRDPVKRAIGVAGLLVALMLVWSSSLQLKAMLARSELSRVEATLAKHTNEFQQVLENQTKTAEINQKLTALRQLAASRFLNGTLLNALQKTAIDDIQLNKLRVNETYAFIEATKSRTNNDGRVIAAKPAAVTERVVVTLDAKDSAPNPGDQRNKYKQTIAGNPYFQAALGKTNEVRLTSFSSPQPDLNGRPFVLFTLECRYPEVTR